MQGVIDVTSAGGTVKRYEIQPDPDRLKRFGVSLSQLQNALSNSNANAGGDILMKGKDWILVDARRRLPRRRRDP